MKRLLLILALGFIMRVELRAEEPQPVLSQEQPLESVARLLAGIPPRAPAYSAWTATGAWVDHQKLMDEHWASLEAQRLKPVAEWRDQHLSLSTGVFQYPFSGPDFVNAYQFYPRCSTYVFYSLEVPSPAPDLAKFSPEQYADLLADLREALGDIFQKQYFITRKMDRHLRTPVLKGNTPLFLVFMTRLGLTPISLEAVRLSPRGEVEASDQYAKGAYAKRSAQKPVPGIKLVFRSGEQPSQTLYYWSLDVSTPALAHHPEFVSYLETLKPTTTFIKSASYLLHGSNFSTIRKTILDTTQELLQDDSGFPYRFLSKGWDVQLFGSYVKPIKDFDFQLQNDLDEAYHAQSTPQALPFTFGYHWHDGHSNIQYAVKHTPSSPR